MIRAALVATAVLCLGPGAPLRAGRAEVVRVERVVFLMGTAATLVAESGDRAGGLDRLERMVRIIEDTEAELSTWRDDSALSAINRRAVGESGAVTPGLCRLLDDLIAWHDATGGAFDPAVGRLVDAWGLRDGGHVPDEAALAQARAHAGLSRLALDRARCRVTRRADIALDAGGFGKGEALERIRRAEGGGAGAWLIDFGGQVIVSGPAAAGPWPVALAHPRRRDRPVLEIALASGSIATSGGSERDVTGEEGQRLGHILDPRSGQPVSRTASVVVWHEDALVADILSTALYVMGPDEGGRWAEARGVAACFLVPVGDGDEVAMRATPAFGKRFGTV